MIRHTFRMLSWRLAPTVPRYLASTSNNNLKRFGIESETLPTIPKLKYPVREYVEGEDQITKQQIYDTFGYKKKQFPRARYVALQRKGVVYHLFDASRYPLGRICQLAATVIRGRNTPLYRNNTVNKGDVCVIVNARDPLLTGKKLLFKKMHYHTGFVGHLRQIPYRDIIIKKPELLIHFLIRKNLPKNNLTDEYFKQVHIFRGNNHNFTFLPQFAPDLNIYEDMPQVDFKTLIEQSPDAKVVLKVGDPQLEKFLNRKLPEDLINFSERKENDHLVTKQVPAISPKEIKKLNNKYKKQLERYRRLSVLKKPKEDPFPGMIYLNDERKAAKQPYYKDALDEDAPEEEEEIMKDVFINEQKRAAEAKNAKPAADAAAGQKAGGAAGKGTAAPKKK